MPTGWAQLYFTPERAPRVPRLGWMLPRDWNLNCLLHLLMAEWAQLTRGSGSMKWTQRIFDALDKPRPFHAQQFLLTLALIMALGAIASDRYHFFFQNYSPFVKQQVLPAIGREHLAGKVLKRMIPPEQIGTARLDAWPWASPLFRNQHHLYGESLIPITSDYLGVWHYTKMVLEGQNPYSIDYFFTYNFQAYDWPMIHNSKVPAQIVGPLSYPPFAVMALVPFFSNNYFLSIMKYFLFIGFVIITAGIIIIYNTPVARGQLAVFLTTLLVTSYPAALLLDRGNIEGIVFVFIAAAILTYQRRYFYISALLIAAAACCKIYPAIYFILFAVDGKWKELSAGFLATVAITIASLATINGDANIVLGQFIHHISGFNEFFLYDGRSIQFGHTLCNLISGLFFLETSDPKIQSSLRLFCLVYPYLVAAFTLGAIWRIRALKLKQRISVLTVMMVYLPFTSFDYTLIYLYIPLLLLLLDVINNASNRILDLLPLWIICMISLPKQYLVGLFNFGPGISFMVNGVGLGLLLMIFLLAKPTSESPEVAFY